MKNRWLIVFLAVLGLALALLLGSSAYPSVPVAAEVAAAPLAVPDLGTGCITYSSAGGAKTIPDNDENGIVSSIIIPPVPKISSFCVNVNMGHSWFGDLSATLTSGNRCASDLFLDGDLAGGEFNGTYSVFSPSFANNGTMFAYQDDAPYEGTYKPLIAFPSNFRPGGKWKLKVADLNYADEGELLSWSITTCTSGVAICTDPHATVTPTPTATETTEPTPTREITPKPGVYHWNFQDLLDIGVNNCYGGIINEVSEKPWDGGWAGTFPAFYEIGMLCNTYGNAIPCTAKLAFDYSGWSVFGAGGFGCDDTCDSPSDFNDAMGIHDGGSPCGIPPNMFGGSGGAVDEWQFDLFPVHWFRNEPEAWKINQMKWYLTSGNLDCPGGSTGGSHTAWDIQCDTSNAQTRTPFPTYTPKPTATPTSTPQPTPFPVTPACLPAGGGGWNIW